MFKTTYTVSVLSNEEIPEAMSLDEVIVETVSGEYMMQPPQVKVEKLTEQEMIEACEEAGGDPEFFLDLDS